MRQRSCAAQRRTGRRRRRPGSRPTSRGAPRSRPGRAAPGHQRHGGRSSGRPSARLRDRRHGKRPRASARGRRRGPQWSAVAWSEGQSVAKAASAGAGVGPIPARRRCNERTPLRAPRGEGDGEDRHGVTSGVGREVRRTTQPPRAWRCVEPPAVGWARVARMRRTCGEPSIARPPARRRRSCPGRPWRRFAACASR